MRNRKSDNALLEQITVQLTVTPSPLTITANNTSRNYGGASPAFTASYAGLASGETAAVALTTQPTIATTATAVSPVGSYPITATGAVSNANYVLQAPVNGTLTITPAPLSIAVNNASRLVGAADPIFTATYSGLVNGETDAVLSTPATFSTTATPASPPGTYPIIATGAVAGNYSISYVAGTLTVLAAAPVAIPTLSGWGMFGLSIALGLLAVTQMRRKE